MVGIAPQFPQEGAHFFESCNGLSCAMANHAPHAPQMVQQVQHGPAKSRKFQHVPAMVPQIPANSHKVPQRPACWTCGTMGWTKYFD
jgi:hypothetical protein